MTKRRTKQNALCHRRKKLTGHEILGGKLSASLKKKKKKIGNNKK